MTALIVVGAVCGAFACLLTVVVVDDCERAGPTHPWLHDAPRD